MRPIDYITTEMIEERNRWLVQVSELTGIPTDDILSKSHKGNIVQARALLIWVLVTLRGFSHTQTARVIGCDHTTITYHNKMMNNYPQPMCVRRWKELLFSMSKKEVVVA